MGTVAPTCNPSDPGVRWEVGTQESLSAHESVTLAKRETLPETRRKARVGTPGRAEGQPGVAVFAHDPSTQEVAGGTNSMRARVYQHAKASTLQVALHNREIRAVARMTAIRDSCWEGAGWVGPGMCGVLVRCDLH